MLIKNALLTIIALLFVQAIGLNAINTSVGQLSNKVSAQAGEESDRRGGGQQNRTATNRVAADCDAQNLTSSNCRIIGHLVTFINILAGLVGITVVGVIAFAGIEYSTSRDNPQRVAVARQRIINALIALVAFMIMMGFLEWVVPGGIFR